MIPAGQFSQWFGITRGPELDTYGLKLPDSKQCLLTVTSFEQRVFVCQLCFLIHQMNVSPPRLAENGEVL